MAEPTVAEYEALREEIDRLKNGIADVAGQSKGFGASFSTAGKQVATGVGNFTSALANGQQGASTFNGAITSGASAVATLSKLLGPLGSAFGKLTEVAGEYIIRTNQQSDALFKSYQDLSKIGGAGKEGMTGVFESMQQFGLTMSQLPEFGAMITQNSEALAQLGGTVNQGIKSFANVAASIQQSGLQAEFERMGMTTKSINEGTISYLRIQAMTGASAYKSQEALNAGAAEYLQQQDKLSRLTGKSIEVLAKEQEARLADQRYAALNREMTQKAAASRAAGDEASAKAVEDQMAENKKLLDQTPKELQKGVQDLMSGVVNSPEAIKAFNALPEMSQMVMSQNFKAADVLASAANESKALLDRNTALAKSGNFDKVFGQYSAYVELSNKNLAQSAVVSAKTATDQQEAARKGADVDINNQVAMREAQRQTTMAFDNLVQKGVSPVTAKLADLSVGIEKFVTSLPDTGEKTALRGRAGEPASGRGQYAPATAGYGTAVKPEDFKKFVEGSVSKGMEALSKVGTPTFTEKMAGLTGKPSLPDTQTVMNQNSKAADVLAKMQALESKPFTPQVVKPVVNVEPVIPPPVVNIVAKQEPLAGPNTRYRTALDDTRPETPKTETAKSESTSGASPELAQGIMQLVSSIGLQTASMNELVELMRRSLGVQGKILQQSRN